jgi:hypothetical protein
MKAKIKADEKAWYEMRDRGESEGKVYMEKMVAKWRTDREKWKAERKVAATLEAIHDKIDAKEDKLSTD